MRGASWGMNVGFYHHEVWMPLMEACSFGGQSTIEDKKGEKVNGDFYIRKIETQDGAYGMAIVEGWKELGRICEFGMFGDSFGRNLARTREGGIPLQDFYRSIPKSRPSKDWMLENGQRR